MFRDGGACSGAVTLMTGETLCEQLCDFLATGSNGLGKVSC